MGEVTAVPLGDQVQARIAFDLHEEAEAAFRKRDPSFHLRVFPLEITIAGSTRLIDIGEAELHRYAIFVESRYCPAEPGIPENAAIIARDHCPLAAGRLTARMLGNRGRIIDQGIIDIQHWPTT